MLLKAWAFYGWLGKREWWCQGEGVVQNLHLQCLRLKVSVCICECVCVWMRRADNWTAARSPGHPAAVEKSFPWPMHGSCQCFTKKPDCVSAVQTDVHSIFWCVHVLPSERALCVSECVSVCVWVCFVPNRCFFFSNVCVLAESDQHQPVQWVWPRWIIFSARLLQLQLTHIHTDTHTFKRLGRDV